MELRSDFIGYCCPEPKIKENLLAWQDLKNVNIETTNRAFKDIYIYELFSLIYSEVHFISSITTLLLLVNIHSMLHYLHWNLHIA